MHFKDRGFPSVHLLRVQPKSPTSEAELLNTKTKASGYLHERVDVMSGEYI